MRPVLPRQLGLRLRAKLVPISAWAALLVAVRRRGRGTEIWIGDSHAMGLNRVVVFPPASYIDMSMFLRAPDGQLILRTGARLMWSLARKGFTPRVLRVARFVNWFGTRGALVPIFSAGWIDVRRYLAEREDETFEFVGEYMSRCQAIAKSMKAERFVLVIPPPHSPWIVEGMPIVGTLEQRVRAFEALRKAIVHEVSAVPGAEVLDLTDLLADEDGQIRPELTGDGFHTNKDGIALVRGRVAELGLERRAVHQ